MTSVFDVFNKVGAVPWWDRRHLTQSFNNRNEKGQDFGLPLNTPVASISSGRVIYSQRMNSDPNSSVGYIVQVENPDGSIFHYQHLRTANVQVGDYVRVGQQVGLSGGCPSSGYGNGGCTHTDQYTTGPHIEVRYSPTYDAAKGAWGQNWIDPGPAFQAYGGQQVSDALPPGWGLVNGNFAGAAGGVLQLPSNFADILGAGLGAGISRGLGQFAQDEIHPVVDFAARGFLIAVGSVIVAVALFAIVLEGGRQETTNKLNKAAETPLGGAAIGGAVGTASSVATANALSPKRPAVREEPKLPALPAPSAHDRDAAAVNANNERLLREKQAARQAREADAARRLAEAREAIDPAKVSEIKPVDLPLPKEAEAGAQARQVGNRAKRDQSEIMRRLKRNIGRRGKR